MAVKQPKYTAIILAGIVYGYRYCTTIYKYYYESHSDTRQSPSGSWIIIGQEDIPLPSGGGSATGCSLA